MKKERTIEFINDGMNCSVIDDIAILTISGNIFDYLLNIELDNEMLEWFDVIEDSKLKGVLFLCEKGSFCEANYAKFLSEVTGVEITPDKPVEVSKFVKTNARALQINMIINFICKSTNLRKVVITAMQGDIVTPFFGTSLASDFRFVDEKTVFRLTHHKYGVHPSGALPFFLPKYLNHSQATEYLLLGGEITAKQALEMKLVNEVFPVNDFKDMCLERAKDICRMSLQYIKTTKALSGTYKNELNQYFQFESNYLFS